MANKLIRALDRGLRVLEYLNTVKATSAHSIARELKLPRPTVYRILETLEQQGFVYPSPSTGGFRLCANVGQLSHGFVDDPWVGAVASPVLRGLTEEMVWPAELTTADPDACPGARVVRYGTHRIRPFANGVGMIGVRRPMLESAAGLAFLAFRPQHAGDTAPTAPQALLAAIRSNGYAIREMDADGRYTQLAVPVLHPLIGVGCLGTAWLDRMVDRTEAVERYLPLLLQAKFAIEARLDCHMAAA